ncbi:MAG: HpcH/HpaI aldolase family protein [Chloroflexota bacterium]
MQVNRVKRILHEGGMALGTYCGPFAGNTIVEIIGHAGFDAAFIDMEHMPLDLREVQVMVLAAERVGITPIVRTPGFDPALILRLLDMGVQGIQVPHISGVEGARAAVRAVRYPPQGDRGIIGSGRAADYGRLPLLRHMEQSNREVLLLVMIEDLPALEQIDEIAAVDGIDIVAIGPADLSRSLGVSGQANHPKLVEAIERIAAAVRREGKAKLSLPSGNPLFPRSLAAMKALGVGYTNLGPSVESRLLNELAAQARETRQALG